MARALEGHLTQPAPYQPGSQTGDVAAAGKEQVENIAAAGRDKLLGTLDHRKGEVARGLKGLADAVEKTTESVAQTGLPESWVKGAARFLRGASDRIETTSSQELWSEAQTKFRQRPGVFIAGLACVGFLAGRMLRR